MKCRIIDYADGAFVVTEQFCGFCLQMANKFEKISEPYGFF